MNDIAFVPLSPSLAELSIPDGPNDFGVRTSGWPPFHDVGIYGAPRWQVRQPMSPDDAWEIETLAGGKLLSAHRALPESIEWTYLTWAEGSRAESGAGVLRALPPGRYLLARSSLEARPEARILLGNERVPSPANARVVHDASPFYAMVLGPAAAAPPATTHPLLGVIALNYVGESVFHGALFFDALAREESHEKHETAAGAQGDLVLVIPVTGEMVLDSMARFSKERSAEDIARWRDTGAHQLAKALTTF